MNCYECGGTYRETSDRHEVVDPYVGTIVIQGVPYYECDKCDDTLYTEQMSRAIEAKRSKRLVELLNEFPIGDFVSAAETASMLGISRQALHKNRRINHGFIHQTIFGGVTVYLRQSVLQFKKTGDGRFPLYPTAYSSQYVEDTVPLQLASNYGSQTGTTQSTRPLFQKSDATLEENYCAN